MRKIVIVLILLIILVSCNLNVDFLGYFYSYSTPNQRFTESQSLEDRVSTESLTSTGDSYSFSIISDVHVNEDTEYFEKLIDEILPADDIIIFDCGDSVQSGTFEQFSKYKEIMDGSGKFWFQSIGNHDLYYSGWKNYKKTIGKSSYKIEIGTEGSSGSLLAIILDSGNAAIGNLQKNWLEEILVSESGLWNHIIVLTHSNFFSNRATTVVQYGDPDEVYYLMSLFEEYGVSYVFMGHEHQWSQRIINNVTYVTLDPVIDRNNSSYEHVTINGDELSLERVYIDY
ncbi:MAG: metallophosphoesterase [Spirochaetales bacterium]|nr:metallophosphoesterase [Spirochaetales bacterium]